MKKSIVFISVLAVVIVVISFNNSCNKKDNRVKLSYSIDSILTNVYVGDTGYTQWPLKFKFLGGDPNELISIHINGLPQRLTVTPDSMVALPTFIQNFVFHGNWAPHGTYPANIIVSSTTTGDMIYPFNLVVVTADCGLVMGGTYSGSNVCSLANYSYTALITATGDSTVNIQNLGGYGSGSNVTAKLNCGTDSITIKMQADGNGDSIRGVGVFTANQLTIYYRKTLAGGGAVDSCIATLNRQ